MINEHWDKYHEFNCAYYMYRSISMIIQYWSCLATTTKGHKILHNTKWEHNNPDALNEQWQFRRYFNGYNWWADNVLMIRFCTLYVYWVIQKNALPFEKLSCQQFLLTNLDISESSIQICFWSSGKKKFDLEQNWLSYATFSVIMAKIRKSVWDYTIWSYS